MRCLLVSGALPLLAILASCSAERSRETEPTPTATVAAPRTLVAADFDPASLGGGVAEMGATNVETAGGLARVTSLVACSKAMATCDPATAPEGTVFTYVLTVTPLPTASPTATPTATGTDPPVVPLEAPAELVRMTRTAPGFNGAVGFSRSEAAAALGADDALTVTLDQHQLIWRVTGGSGWQAGKPITFWWQSTAAPAKPSAAYRLEYAGKRADIAAPFPAADKPVERGSAR